MKIFDSKTEYELYHYLKKLGLRTVILGICSIYFKIESEEEE